MIMMIKISVLKIDQKNALTLYLGFSRSVRCALKPKKKDLTRLARFLSF